jgi:hypothetical protein
MSVDQQKYHLDLTLNFSHDYDRKVKGESAPATNGASRFEMRRVERVEHLTFEQCSRLMERMNALIDDFEKEVG